MGDKTTNYIFGELNNLWRVANSTTTNISKIAKAMSTSNKCLGAAIILADLSVLMVWNEVTKVEKRLRELEKQGTMEC